MCVCVRACLSLSLMSDFKSAIKDCHLSTSVAVWLKLIQRLGTSPPDHPPHSSSVRLTFTAVSFRLAHFLSLSLFTSLNYRLVLILSQQEITQTYLLRRAEEHGQVYSVKAEQWKVSEISAKFTVMTCSGYKSLFCWTGFIVFIILEMRID